MQNVNEEIESVVQLITTSVQPEVQYAAIHKYLRGTRWYEWMLTLLFLYV